MWVLKVNDISWPWPKVVYIQRFKPDFLKNYYAVLSQILYESFQVQGNDFFWHDACQVIKMAAMPINGKNPSKIFFAVTAGLFYGKKWKQWNFQKLLQPVTWKLVVNQLS